VFTCGCPCGSGKAFALLGSNKIEQIPYRFAGLIPAIHESSLMALDPEHLAGRYAEPPDPPPKLTLHS
jgi:hypothetical protein